MSYITKISNLKEKNYLQLKKVYFFNVNNVKHILKKIR